jgi:peptidoglycan/xylan/chitin deacetylase (PgdA/CDA1 family)
MKTATVSLDLDNKWSYLKTHGDESWRDFPSYLDTVVPMALELFAQLDAKATFFVVGQDADLASERTTLRALGESSHEIGNHSYHHEPWLHLKSPEAIRQEMTDSHEAIAKATGREPIGFRGPGFSLSSPTLQALSDLGYEYDCSTLPMFLGPLARRFYFRRSKLGDEERVRRARLFGRFTDGFRPIKPYRWDLGGATLVEIPVTTMPFTRLPIHISYLLFISKASDRLARAYFESALGLCRLLGVQPSLLVHPLDLLGFDDTDGLGFFPGMDLEGATKRRRVRVFLEMLRRDFRLISMRDASRAVDGAVRRRSVAVLP